MSGQHPGAATLPTGDTATFDTASGSWVERLVFNHRPVVLLLCGVVTLLLGWQALQLQLNASFEKTMPSGHPYIVNFLAHQSELSGGGNTVRVVVETAQGSIFDADYLHALQRISDELYLLPGVDRPRLKSLWTATTRWVAVTEDGLDGGPVIPENYDGSTSAVQRVRTNVERSGEIGQLVAPDFKSSMIVVPLQPNDPRTGRATDYAELGRSLEALRAKVEAEGLHLHITGFAKVVSDLIEGTRQVLAFFGIAAALAALMLYRFTRCLRSTLLVLACSVVAVVWQLGLLPLLGFPLDPYSVLVPFLVFAIGMSHGAQKMNGIMQDIGRGMSRVAAARHTFRRLFLAGLTALLCDAVGFGVLMLIPIQAIRELALIASLGVGALIFTNLILLPVLLSHVGVNPAAAQASLMTEGGDPSGKAHRRWQCLEAFTRRRWALRAVVAAGLLGAIGLWVSLHLKVGDLDPGAPELRADSRYNRDADYLTRHYGASNDVFVVIVRTPANQCAGYAAQSRMDRLEWQLRGLSGVESTASLSSLTRKVLVLMNEGNAKWYELLPTQSMLNSVTNQVPPELFNTNCDTLSLVVYLKDHKADTLASVAAATERFAAENDTAEVKFLMAAGNAGIEAATNAVVRSASREMLLWVYGAVTLLCLVTFRSWRAVVCAVLPLALTSVLAEALMVVLGMGVKVATLPVIALGVGIGVDYALYILSIVLAQLRAGRSLTEAYAASLSFTGRVVMLTGLTLAAGVATWALSPIKFQADMGILLAFMFVWNMLGGLILLPALCYFLLRPGRPRSAVTPSLQERAVRG